MILVVGVEPLPTALCIEKSCGCAGRPFSSGSDGIWVIGLCRSLLKLPCFFSSLKSVHYSSSVLRIQSIEQKVKLYNTNREIVDFS